MPQLRQIQQLNQVNKTTFTQTISEMTSNVALYIMRKTDHDKNGFIEQVDLTRLSLDDPVSYRLLEDLFNFAPDFMDNHRQVITGNLLGGNTVTKTSNSGGNAVTKMMASSLRNQMNNDLNVAKAAKKTTFQGMPAEPRATQANQAANRPRNKNQIEKSPGGMNEVIKGQMETSAPESLTLKRPPPKTKKDRQADCNAKGMSAEQLRLNPMAGMDDEEAKGGPALTAEQKRLNPMAAKVGAKVGMKVMSGATTLASKQMVANTLKRSVNKQNLD